jgi:hypothetical protein
MLVEVTPVVNGHAARPVRPAKAIEVLQVRLLPRAHLHPGKADVLLEAANAVDLSTGEVVAPHAKRGATPRRRFITAFADLKDLDRTAPNVCQVLYRHGPLPCHSSRRESAAKLHLNGAAAVNASVLGACRQPRAEAFFEI